MYWVTLHHTNPRYYIEPFQTRRRLVFHVNLHRFLQVQFTHLLLPWISDSVSSNHVTYKCTKNTKHSRATSNSTLEQKDAVHLMHARYSSSQTTSLSRSASHTIHHIILLQCHYKYQDLRHQPQLSSELKQVWVLRATQIFRQPSHINRASSNSFNSYNRVSEEHDAVCCWTVGKRWKPF